MLILPINLIFKLLSAIPEIASTTAREAIHITPKAFLFLSSFLVLIVYVASQRKVVTVFLTIDLAREG